MHENDSDTSASDDDFAENVDIYSNCMNINTSFKEGDYVQITKTPFKNFLQ